MPNDPQSDRTDFGYEQVPWSEKARRVRGVFDSVAPKYDLMNDLMSGGMHRLWKDAAVARLNPRPGEVILDVAGGTGDIARRIQKRVEAIRRRRGGELADIHVCDINEEMLEAGRRRGEEGFTWKQADAEAGLRHAGHHGAAGKVGVHKSFRFKV